MGALNLLMFAVGLMLYLLLVVSIIGTWRNTGKTVQLLEMQSVYLRALVRIASPGLKLPGDP